MIVRSKAQPVFLALLFWAIFWVLGAAAARAQCGGAIAPPSITVRTLTQPPLQDVSRGIADLSADRHLAVPRGLENFRFAIGVTAPQAKARANWQMQGQPQDGSYCWTISQLQIDVTVSTRVYIAREVPRESCLWNEIVRHEAKHVRIDQKFFPQLSGILRPRVSKVIAHSKLARDQASARNHFGAVINQAIEEAVAAFQVVRNQQQLAIDTPLEYSRPNRICGEAEVAAAVRRAGLQ